MKGKNLIVAGAAFVVAAGGLLLFTSRAALVRRSESVQCGNQMSSIGCAARLWADDTGNYPTNFQSLSNEIISLRILHCPSDASRALPHSWPEVTRENVSYEILSPGIAASNTTEVFFRCKFHKHLGYGDGTVFDGKKRRTKELF
jgi:hypothetical protein